MTRPDLNKLAKEVKQLLGDIDKTHRYSMSKITDLHNQVFNITDKPQAVASILLRKVRQLREWNESQTKV